MVKSQDSSKRVTRYLYYTCHNRQYNISHLRSSDGVWIKIDLVGLKAIGEDIRKIWISLFALATKKGLILLNAHIFAPWLFGTYIAPYQLLNITTEKFEKQWKKNLP
jgi:hypothetical protein